MPDEYAAKTSRKIVPQPGSGSIWNCRRAAAFNFGLQPEKISARTFRLDRFAAIIRLDSAANHCAAFASTYNA